ncbi:MAG: preprotein translocase subunit SecE [Pseudonocardiaceae bacterium]|nr:preprotein translocase subunit SecE [Pseudonocardiaceae bacterium]
MSDDRGAGDAEDRGQRSDDAAEPASAASRRERRGGATRPGASGPTAAAARGPGGARGARAATSSLPSRLARFLREVVAELRKVIWPTRDQLVTYTAVVLVFVAFMITFVFLMDMGFGRVVLYVFGE